MKYGARIGLIVALVIISRIVLAYEVDTHEKMSEPAAKSSVLKADNEVLRRLGLQFPIEDDRQQFPNSKGEPRNILNLIKEGSKLEDSLIFIRPIHHFYDPISGEALLPLLAKPSPTWALEDLENFGSQAFSFRHARDYLYKALTLSDEQERKENFGLTFQTLGHVIHHIQDMAQPQHARNDIHPSVDQYNFYRSHT